MMITKQAKYNMVITLLLLLQIWILSRAIDWDWVAIFCIVSIRRFVTRGYAYRRILGVVFSLYYLHYGVCALLFFCLNVPCNRTYVRMQFADELLLLPIVTAPNIDSPFYNIGSKSIGMRWTRGCSLPNRERAKTTTAVYIFSIRLQTICQKLSVRPLFARSVFYVSFSLSVFCLTFCAALWFGTDSVMSYRWIQ